MIPTKLSLWHTARTSSSKPSMGLPFGKHSRGRPLAFSLALRFPLRRSPRAAFRRPAPGLPRRPPPFEEPPLDRAERGRRVEQPGPAARLPPPLAASPGRRCPVVAARESGPACKGAAWGLSPRKCLSARTPSKRTSATSTQSVACAASKSCLTWWKSTGGADSRVSPIETYTRCLSRSCIRLISSCFEWTSSFS